MQSIFSFNHVLACTGPNANNEIDDGWFVTFDTTKEGIIYIDSVLIMRTHIFRTVWHAIPACVRSAAFISLSADQCCLMSLVTSLVLSRLYLLLHRSDPAPVGPSIQAVLNAASRRRARWRDSVTPVFAWPAFVKSPGTYALRLAVLVYRCLDGIGPSIWLFCDKMTDVQRGSLAYSARQHCS